MGHIQLPTHTAKCVAHTVYGTSSPGQRSLHVSPLPLAPSRSYPTETGDVIGPELDHAAPRGTPPDAGLAHQD